MIYYSAEARAYGLMMFLVVSAVLSMLLAVDTKRDRYWVLFAVFAATAFYTHYTSLFVLAMALAWLLWTEPGSRRRALLATLGAVVLAVPWIPGLIADLQSPTLKILSALSPFTAGAVRIDIQHWALGYPYTVAGGLDVLPGTPALALLALALLLAVAGIALRVRRTGWRDPLRRVGGARAVLMLALALATPVGEILGSATGDHIVGVRDLAASWPFLALAGAAFVIAAGPRLGLIGGVLGFVAFALAAPKMLESRFQRPDYQGAADYVAAHARAGDVVIDETGGLSPGPLTGFDVALHRPLTVVRARSPAERDHPFTVFDPLVSLRSAVDEAVRGARGGRVFIVTPQLLGSSAHPNPAPNQFPSAYRLTALPRYPGIERTLVAVYSRSPASAR
jgi:Dolichyl-phosphate-mannose-protein mannosyltransferase